MTICNRLSSAILLGVGLSAAGARAQPAEDQAAARSLFEEGRKLLKAGSYGEACPKLEATAKLYSSPGILLNLGDCYEKTGGRTASAWTEFGESAAAAERAQRADQSAEARRRQPALEPKLARLTIQVAHEVLGLAVSRDGTASVDQYQSTRTPWAVGLVGAIAGGAAAATGLVLIARASPGAAAAGELRATPWLAAGGGGLEVARSW